MMSDEKRISYFFSFEIASRDCVKGNCSPSKNVYFSLVLNRIFA